MRFRYRLRTLLIFAALLGVAAGYTTRYLHERSQALKAIEMVARLGGVAYFTNDRQPDGTCVMKNGGFFIVDMDDSPLNVIGIDLGIGECTSGDGVTTLPRDSDLQCLIALPKLEWLVLYGSSHITDAGVNRICKLRKLNSLDICFTNISANGRTQIRQRRPDLEVRYDGCDY